MRSQFNRDGLRRRRPVVAQFAYRRISSIRSEPFRDRSPATVAQRTVCSVACPEPVEGELRAAIWYRAATTGRPLRGPATTVMIKSIDHQPSPGVRLGRKSKIPSPYSLSNSSRLSSVIPCWLRDSSEAFIFGSSSFAIALNAASASAIRLRRTSRRSSCDPVGRPS